jgi:D-alanyl-D-alanine carboxypeptidase (penicillin-binding protein 5/6)
MYGYAPPAPPKRRHRVRKRFILVLVLFFAAYLGWSWLAVPTSAFSGSTVQTQPPTLPAARPTLVWPETGQAAIGTEAFGVLANHGQDKSVPIASVAKIILALSVLKEKPFSAGTQGATLTMTQADQQSYSSWLMRGGSVAPVQAGEQLSEYQALQALLLPSANNMADTLATWAFGSTGEYTTYANEYVAELGLTQTHLADASGFDPHTVSTARDLVKIGQLAMKNTVISKIVTQPSATIPVAGTIRNVNSLLGSNGFVGIKTGNTDQAGGCLLFAVEHNVADQTVTLVGAVLGSPDRFQALAASNALVISAKRQLANSTVIKSGTHVATYKLPWGETANARVDDTLQAITWAGNNVTNHIALDEVRLPVKKGDSVGTYVATSRATQTRNSVPLIIDNNITGPSFWWRFTHPADTWNLRFN